MSDSSKPDYEKQFAVDLENEFESRAKNRNPEETSSNEIESSNSERIQRVQPALDLLLEFKDQPSFLSPEAAVETGEVDGDATLCFQAAGPVPDLTRLGRFKLKEEIGRGGNGIVFRAFDEKLDRVVALKIPRLSAALSGEAKTRFEREARAAASLNHPGIVAVHEVGHEQGVDYIVSQFCDGVSLTRWLETNSLSHQQVAASISFLADAMQHAHARGVLHRDLKPSNIILEHSNTDEIEIPHRLRIVDFGLAAIHTDVSDELTATGSIIGTPAYMSPEQTQSKSISIGTATDVYGLGVILYQMLTRQPPFSGDDLIQVIEKVRKQDPVSPTQLNRAIPTDLAAITLKCLEKRPEDRYRSTADLKADLDRFLNNEPVLASPATTFMRLKKWAQRNPWGSALILSLIIGVTATSYAAIRATSAEQRSRLSEAKTKTEAEKVVAVSEYLEEMFQIPSYLARKKNQLQGKDVTAEQILRHAANKIQNDLNSQPEVKARLMTIIGASLTDIASYQEAQELLRSGLELNLSHLAPSDANLAKSHFELGRLLRKVDQIDEAEQQIRSAIVILELDIEQNHKLLANCYNDLGILLRPTDPFAARKSYCKARNLIETYQPDKKENWTLSANIATLDYLSGQYDLAAETFEHALDLAIQSHGESHPKVAIILGNLSRTYMQLGQLKKAEQFRLRGAEITEQELGSEHVDLGVELIGLVAIQQKLGKWNDADQNGERALQILKSALPKHHRHTISAINNHVITKIRMFRLDEAGQLATELEEADSRRVGDDFDFTSLKNQLLIAQLERMTGKYESALSRIERVLNHQLSEKNKAIGADARFANAFYLADTNNDDAEQIMADALRYTDAAGVLQKRDRYYTEAVFWALYGDQKKAIQKLGDAIEEGYLDARILADPDLRSLSDSIAFRDIQDKVRFGLQKQQD